MTAVFALLATVTFAAAYLAWSGTHADAVEVLGISLSAAVITLLIGLIADLAARRRGDMVTTRMIRWLVVRNLTLAALTAGIVGGVSTWGAGTYDTSASTLAMQFGAVTILAGAVAYGELVSRYRDTPGRLMAAAPTAAYVCVNIAASVAALMLVKEFKVFTAPDHKMVYEALLAGFGAIAFFRTSLFTVRVSGTDIGVGPSTLLKALLDSSDMMLDRWQGVNRGLDVSVIMQGVDFDKASAALPALCFTMMREFPDDQQKKVGESIRGLTATTSIEPAAKARILGVYMIQYVGADVLKRAVDTLGASIKNGADARPSQ